MTQPIDLLLAEIDPTYADYLNDKNYFKQAVKNVQRLNGLIGQVEIAFVLHPNDAATRQRLDELLKRRFQYALAAFRLQRRYDFPVFLVGHIAGPNGYYDLPIYQLPELDF